MKVYISFQIDAVVNSFGQKIWLEVTLWNKYKICLEERKRQLKEK